MAVFLVLNLEQLLLMFQPGHGLAVNGLNGAQPGGVGVIDLLDACGFLFKKGVLPVLGTGGIDAILPAGQLVLGCLDDAGQLGVNLLGLDAKCLIERLSYGPAKIPCLLTQSDHIFEVLQAAVELVPGLHCTAAPGLQLAGQGSKRADAPGQQGCTPVQALGGHGEILARLPEGAVHRLDGMGQFRRTLQPPGHAASGGCPGISRGSGTAHASGK